MKDERWGMNSFLRLLQALTEELQNNVLFGLVVGAFKTLHVIFK